MGCISSKPSNHQQPSTQVIIPNHHLLSLVPPSTTTTTHTINDVLELIPSKHDHALTIHTNTNLKVDDDTLERCSSFHTVQEYDELVQRITNQNDPGTTDSTCKNDRNIDTKDEKKQDMEFQTVASLRQWLHAPGGGGGGGGDADAATTDHLTPKFGFSFHETNRSNDNIKGPEENPVLVKTGKQEEEETIVELVAAFDKYLQQLQIDEDDILKQIHNIIN